MNLARYAVLALLLPLAGCSDSDRLSRVECIALKDKEKEYVAFRVESDAALKRTMNRASVNRHVEMCGFSTGYTREEFECVQQAKTMPDRGTCLLNAWERFDPDWDVVPERDAADADADADE
jgi:hypothetical protein